MLFNTPQFVFVLIGFLISWYVFPNKIKKPILLIFSYYYAYTLGGIWTVAALVYATLLTFICGLFFKKNHHNKLVLICFILLLVFPLVYEKLSPSFSGLIGRSLSKVSMIGLSYYVLSAISYIVDIYRGEDDPEKSLPDTAIWIAFFPKLIAGPIERHRQFKEQLKTLHGLHFDMERIKRGLLICSFGYFCKIIIADRIGPFVDSIFADVFVHHGFILILTIVLYAFQIYFDFSGYSLIAYGIAYAMGLQITKNFNHPFFSENTSEFWSRWHVSLSSWLRDYIYIPLGGNRKGRLRQNINLMITFLVSGIWHGAGINYILWGAANGFIQIIERMVRKVVKLPHTLNRIITFLIFSGTLIIFRADSILTVKSFIKRMAEWNFQEITDGTIFRLGIDLHDWIILIAALIIVFVIEHLQFNGVSIYDEIQKKNIVVRWIIYYMIIVLLIIFGIYGTAYDASNFIYFKF